MSALSDIPLVWKSEGATWQDCLSVAGQGTIERLYPNVYRVSFITRGDDPTPARVIGTFDLTKKKSDTAIAVPKVGFPLTVKILDDMTGKPIPHEQLLLFAPDGPPIASGSSNFRTQADDEGAMRYSSLEPGKYRLEVGPRGWWYALHPESVRVVPVEVMLAQENAITVRYTEPIPVRDP